MTFALLIYEDAAGFAARTGPEQAAYWGAWTAYAQAVAAAGVMAGGKGLLPPSAATTVRVRDGDRQVQDGPFADTKEQLGGFFLLDVPDLDAALAWAARAPVVRGSVEVRPALPDPTAAAS